MPGLSTSLGLRKSLTGLGVALGDAGNTGGGLPVYDYYIDSQAAFDALTITNGKRIAVSRGLILRPSTAQAFALSASNVLIEAIGAGADPLFLGSVQHTSGWSNVSGTVWQKDIGYTALNVFSRLVRAVTKFILGTFGSLTAGQFGVSGNVVQINSATDPNTLTIEIPKTGDITNGNGILFTGANNTVRGLAFWFFAYNGFEMSTGDGNQTLFCDFSYSTNDGGGAHSSVKNWLVEASTFRRNGQQRGLTTAPGDGFSAHDTSGGIVRGNFFIDNEKEAIGNQPSTSVLMEYNFLKNNYQEFVVLGTGGVGSTKGQQTFRYNVVVWVPSGQASGLGAVAVSSSSQRPTVNVYNNTLYCAGTAGAGQCGVNVKGGDLTVTNNVIKGFNRGFDYRSTDAANASLVNDYNCMHGNATNYFNNGTPGVVQGANDKLADPLFVDAASDNFNLQSGSPCINAGANLGLTRDYAGNPVPYGSAPDIGAFERQVA